MILPDINLLVYAHSPSAERHDAAREWWEQLLNSAVRVHLPWAVTFGFLRLVTSRRVLTDPETPDRACSIVEGWLDRPNVAPVEPGPRHREIAFGLLRKIGTAANLTTDAHLAAVAIEHGLELMTTDADYGRFPGLRWSNPLATIHPPRSARRSRKG